jgi:hypothetical protein
MPFQTHVPQNGLGKAQKPNRLTFTLTVKHMRKAKLQRSDKPIGLDIINMVRGFDTYATLSKNSFILLVARERFELSSAGPKPAMLVRYTTGLLYAGFTVIQLLNSS